jgi:hypothetical protein
MTVENKDGAVWIIDTDGERIDVDYHVDSDGEVDEVTINGENIEYMDLPDDVYDEIYSNVAEAFLDIRFD